MITNAIIGKNIRRERLIRGLSQLAVGRYLGVSFQQIQKYEAGTNRIAAIQLYRLALLFECPIETFLHGHTESNHIAQARATDMRLHGNRQLLANFHSIQSERTRRHICAIVHIISEQTHET